MIYDTDISNNDEITHSRDISRHAIAIVFKLRNYLNYSLTESNTRITFFLHKCEMDEHLTPIDTK